MKFEQLTKRFLRLERWFTKYQEIIHEFRNKLETTVGVHLDIVSRYSEMQDKLDEINARLKQEKSFRDSTRNQFKEIIAQIELTNESIKEFEKFIDEFGKSLSNSKKLQKLFNREEK